MLTGFCLSFSPFGSTGVGAEGTEPMPLAYYSSVTYDSKNFFVHDLAMILCHVLSFFDLCFPYPKLRNLTHLCKLN